MKIKTKEPPRTVSARPRQWGEDPQRPEWAPFDADRNLAAVGPVKLSTASAPTPQLSESTVTRAEPPKLLEYSWGGNDLRWQLESFGGGTRLTLWHNIDRRFINWGAAGWLAAIDHRVHKAI